MRLTFVYLILVNICPTLTPLIFKSKYTFAESQKQIKGPQNLKSLKWITVTVFISCFYIPFFKVSMFLFRDFPLKLESKRQKTLSSSFSSSSPVILQTCLAPSNKLCYFDALCFYGDRKWSRSHTLRCWWEMFDMRGAGLFLHALISKVKSLERTLLRLCKIT